MTSHRLCKHEGCGRPEFAPIHNERHLLFGHHFVAMSEVEEIDEQNLLHVIEFYIQEMDETGQPQVDEDDAVMYRWCLRYRGKLLELTPEEIQADLDTMFGTGDDA